MNRGQTILGHKGFFCGLLSMLTHVPRDSYEENHSSAAPKDATSFSCINHSD
jgi:hypothetical protein